MEVVHRQLNLCSLDCAIMLNIYNWILLQASMLIARRYNLSSFHESFFLLKTWIFRWFLWLGAAKLYKSMRLSMPWNQMILLSIRQLQLSQCWRVVTGHCRRNRNNKGDLYDIIIHTDLQNIEHMSIKNKTCTTYNSRNRA